MKTIEANGARIPALGLGTWTLKGGECCRVVRDALDLGYRHVDTARMYGNEAEVGRAIAESGIPRGEIFLTTKLWPDQLAPEAVHRETERSLEELRTDYVDLLLIHWPNPEIPVGETLAAMAGEQDRGRARHLGVSNFPTKLLDEAAASHGDRLVANQVEYHPLLAQDAVLAACRERGLAVTAYCPLARGKVFDEAPVREAADRHGKSPAQVVLRWLLSQDGVAAIPRSTSRDHLAANLDVFDFELEAAEIDRISSLARGGRLVDMPGAPDWD